jgi:hypothetical protein
MTSHSIQHRVNYDVDCDDYAEGNHTDRIQPVEKRSKRPRYFPSNTPQSFIINAVSGVPYPYLVGSKEQSLLYKIVDATGTCDKDGYLIKSRDNLPNFNTNHLFFDSPEQCMSHMRLTLNSDVVKGWYDIQRAREQPMEE